MVEKKGLKLLINRCPKCHAITYNDDGWRYGNLPTRFCLCCGTAMDTYKDGWLHDAWIAGEIEEHKEYLNDNMENGFELWFEGKHNPKNNIIV